MPTVASTAQVTAMEIQNFSHGTKLTISATSKKHFISKAILTELTSKGVGPHYVIENGKTYYIDELFTPWLADAFNRGVFKLTLANESSSELQVDDEITCHQQKALDNKSKKIGACIHTILSLVKDKKKYMHGDKPNALELANLLIETLDNLSHPGNTGNTDKAILKGSAVVTYPGLSERTLRSAIKEGLEILG